MNFVKKTAFYLSLGIVVTSCVSKKKLTTLQNQHDQAQNELVRCGDKLKDYENRLNNAQRLQTETEAKRSSAATTVQEREQQINTLKDQIGDLRAQVSDLKNSRDKQVEQVGNMTILTKEANQNIERTLSQLEQKDRYINRLQSAKTKADSINLALAVNLTKVLRDGIDDQDIEVKVDKTVVMVNLSDKMLFTSGSYTITDKANGILAKIAQIVQSRPELEVMVEGYTDNVAIKTECLDDNWDLSVKRSTSVVRALQGKFGVNPNKLIAAGRGEFNALTTNDTPANRATNRRTRIILMPKIDQFYDLLAPAK
jgi:chemotaxis protein MotB